MGGKGSGRLTKKQTLQREGGNAMGKLERSAPEAAQYLSDVANGNIPAQKVSWPRINTSIYILNQVLGMPKSRLTVTGDNGKPLRSYTEIILMAEKAAAEQPGGQIVTVEARQLPAPDLTASKPCLDEGLTNTLNRSGMDNDEPDNVPDIAERPTDGSMSLGHDQSKETGRAC